jgi:hypothetical protein
MRQRGVGRFRHCAAGNATIKIPVRESGFRRTPMSMIFNDTDLFNGAPMTGWRVLIGIDDLVGINGQAPDPNNGVDGCCWPSLDTLKALIGAVK